MLIKEGYGKGMILSLTLIGCSYLVRCEGKGSTVFKALMACDGYDDGDDARNEIRTVGQ